MDAFWASLDKERPSGDDPKRVAFALSQFYSDLQSHIARARSLRWQTPLFKELDPKVAETLTEIRQTVEALTKVLPQADPDQLEKLKNLDLSLRRSSYALEQEERECGLPVFASPKLNKFNYLFEGWKRGFLSSGPLRGFVSEYIFAVQQSLKEISQAEKNVNPRESEEEKEAVQEAITAVTELEKALKSFQASLDSSPQQSLADRVLGLSDRLSEVYQTLEQCAPLETPCPFCGGQISLSGRCRSCTRRLPHLEEQDVEGPEIQSEFISNNCRAVDLALLRWEQSPENPELWKDCQAAVRSFADQVNAGRKSLEMLAVAMDRPVDSASEIRKKETSLQEVAKAFQDAVTTLSKFTLASAPPSTPLPASWREPLQEAELQLREIELALQVEKVE